MRGTGPAGGRTRTSNPPAVCRPQLANTIERRRRQEGRADVCPVLPPRLGNEVVQGEFHVLQGGRRYGEPPMVCPAPRAGPLGRSPPPAPAGKGSRGGPARSWPTTRIVMPAAMGPELVLAGPHGAGPGRKDPGPSGLKRALPRRGRPRGHVCGFRPTGLAARRTAISTTNREPPGATKGGRATTMSRPVDAEVRPPPRVEEENGEGTKHRPPERARRGEDRPWLRLDVHEKRRKGGDATRAGRRPR